MSSFLFRSVIPRPHAAHEVAGLGPDRGGVDRGCRERGVSEDGRDRGERDAGGNSSDAVAVAKAPGARLRALDAGRSHDRAHLAVRRLPGDGPKGPGRAPRARLEPSQPMHELEGVHESSGTGTARQWSVLRFRFAIRSSPASRSTSHARIPSASDTRHPVIARVRAKVWTPGLGCARAAVRKRSRSARVRYFRPPSPPRGPSAAAPGEALAPGCPETRQNVHSVTGYALHRSCDTSGIRATICSVTASSSSVPTTTRGSGRNGELMIWRTPR